MINLKTFIPLMTPTVRLYVKEIRIKKLDVEITGKDGTTRSFTADDANREIIGLGLGDLLRDEV